jgi:hypothetical protein
MYRLHLLPSLAIVIAALGLAACQSAPGNKLPADNSAAEASALVPDYRPALESNASDYIAFLKTWFHDATPEIDSADIVRYAFSAADKTAELAAERLIAGNEAFCNRGDGKIVSKKDPDLLQFQIGLKRAAARAAPTARIPGL